MPRHMPVVLSVMVALVTLGSVPTEAGAFCGFYVSGANTKLYNNATAVVLMREGTKTVLSMQNNYQGPPKDFAMVVPVPVILQQDHVKTLQPGLFDKIDQLASPRLVEYWEQNPCTQRSRGKRVALSGTVRGMGSGGGGLGKGSTVNTVKVEAQFAVGEYEIVILSATEAQGLERWLRENRYNIPDGASAVLRPYIEGGMYFFVAKVDAKKVAFNAKGQTMLSPLRFHYDSKQFKLPVRLGLLNAKGTQDLLIHILARNTRYEVKNAPNVTIPTNLIVANATRKRFGEFYAALLDRTLKQHPGAVITEYSWNASTCDPCPGPTLNPGDIHTLGGDVLQGSQVTTSSFTAVPGRPKILGGLDRELVRRVVRRYVPQLRSCAQNLLQAQPGASPSAMMLKLNIDPTGKVVAAMPSRSSGFGALDNCVLKRAKSWRFPAPKSAGITQVELPLAFKARMVSRGGRSDWTLTRLHARYDAKSLGQDLVFTQAKPIVGGRGMPTGKRGRMDEQGARQGSINNFQGRYIILNPWRDKVACQNPMRGIWGGPPNGQGNSTNTARNNAFAPRGRLKLPRFVVRDGPASTLPPSPR